jgi:hypothetical protein
LIVWKKLDLDDGASYQRRSRGEKNKEGRRRRKNDTRKKVGGEGTRGEKRREAKRSTVSLLRQF